MIFLALFQAVSRMQTRWNQQQCIRFCWSSKLGTCADLVRHYLILRLWPCCTLEPCEYCTSPDRSLGSSMANRTCACEQCAAGLLGYRIFFFFLMWWKHSDDYFDFVPYSYLLATLVPLLASTLDAALHHKSDSNIWVTVHNICFSVYLLWLPRKLFH